MSQGQKVFVEYLREQARWRSVKAEEYPEDERNCRSASGLEDLAQYVLSLPDNDMRVVAIVEHGFVESAGVFIPPPVGRGYFENALSRFRFHRGPDEDCNQFLTELAGFIKKDAADYDDMHYSEAAAS